MYSSLIRSVLEYASPVWANLLEYLSLLIEGVQKKALEIIFPGPPYRDELVHCGLRTLSDRRTAAVYPESSGHRTCYHSAQLCPMDTIHVQAPSERISPWPLLTVSTNLLHIDIPGKLLLLKMQIPGERTVQHNPIMTQKLFKPCLSLDIKGRKRRGVYPTMFDRRPSKSRKIDL